VQLQVTPADALYDEPVEIRLTGFPPQREVSVTALAKDGQGRRWSSEATLVTDSGGELDLAWQAPRSGSYRCADSNGLLWSLRLDSSVLRRGPFLVMNPTEVTIHLAANIDGAPVARATLRRRFMNDDVERGKIREDGVVATFFRPPGSLRPGVIVLGGSGGGLAEDQPALLASHGYAVLSLGYFLMPGLPQDLIEIPLEYFERAIRWMKNHPAVDAERIAVCGASRGGELALLLGATFPDIKAVIGYVPSGVVWPGIGATPSLPKSAWTWRKQPVEFMATPRPDPEVWSKPPVAITPWFLKSIANQDSVRRSAIAVEKINGPVLMFSGTDDQMWPSLNLADLAVQRMSEHGFTHPYEHVSYAGAGHFIRYPYAPTISEIYHPITKQMMALGGTSEANHIANLDSWHRMLSFLNKFLG
jgi:dienelactone hydrolase